MANLFKVNLDKFHRAIRKESSEPFVIAEIGQAHDGSLGSAVSLMEAAAECGVNAIKFQTHIAREESSNLDKFRVNVFPQDTSRFDYWKRMEFSEDQWKMLARKAYELGVLFLSSPFSIKAVEILEGCGVPAWKLASGELENLPMIERVLETEKPLLISTGLASWDEIGQVHKLTSGRERVLFQCTTQYPSQPETWGLNNIKTMKKRFSDCAIGLSDHSGEIFPAIAAYSMGAVMFEVHVAWSKSMFGPDSSSSLNMVQLRQLVDGLRALFIAEQNPIDKDLLRKNNAEIHQLFGRSIYAARMIPPNKEIELDDLAFLKPGIGIPAKEYSSMLGKKMKHEIAEGQLLNLEDVL